MLHVAVRLNRYIIMLKTVAHALQGEKDQVDLQEVMQKMAEKKVTALIKIAISMLQVRITPSF